MSKYKKILLPTSLILLVVSLIPLMWLGKYTHALGDDFHYGLSAYRAYVQSGSIVVAIKTAFEEMLYQYQVWQGTYSAMFLMCLPPQTFGDFFYKLFPAVLLLCFTFGIFSFFHELICCYLKADKKVWIITSALVTVECLEHVPLMGETFYWYNGSMYYTGFLAFTLFFMACVLKLLRKPSVGLIVWLGFSAIFIAGGNYVSLLPTMITINLLVFYAFLTKKERIKKIGLIVTDILMLGGFAVSAVCPGNAVRMATAQQTSAVKTVIKAIYQGFRSLYNWTTVYFFIMLILLTPLFIEVIKETAFEFKYPILVCGIIFGIYCSSACPTYYAESSAGHARCFDLFWYLICILGTVDYFYMLGGIIRYREKKGQKNFSLLKSSGIAICSVTSIFVVLLILRGFDSLFAAPNSYSAAQMITSGDAAYYEEQYQSRKEQLADSSVSDVVFDAYDVPESLWYVLYLGDLSEDTNNSSNQDFAAYYGKNSVTMNSVLQIYY